LWTSIPLSRHKLFASEKYAVILVFALCVVIRAIPEVVAYPYPIGYDVVNYYIPFVADFEENWPVAIHQFPLYVLILHGLQMLTFLPAQSVVASVAIAIFGIFGASLFFVARSLLKLNVIHSIFVALVVIFQMAVLRTAWDLHRDLFALAAMMFAFVLIGRNDPSWKGVAPIILLGTLIVAADRMIGSLFCVSLVAYAVIFRRRDIAAMSIFVTGLFTLLMIVSYASSNSLTTNIEALSARAPPFYNPQNLLILFAVVAGMLLLPALIGFFKMKGSLLKIPLLISLVGSFSWLVFPEINILVADRWIIICGIFLSIFAGYGIVHILKALNPRLSTLVASSFLVCFAAIGIAYATMPNDNPFFLYGLVRSDIEEFVPVTMQFNSLDIKDNGKMISAIDWINHNTEQDAVIFGQKHWRGFMKLYLEGDRQYLYADNQQDIAEAIERNGGKTYLISSDRNSPQLFIVENISRDVIRPR
jgi:hypothetical protein